MPVLVIEHFWLDRECVNVSFYTSFSHKIWINSERDCVCLCVCVCVCAGVWIKSQPTDWLSLSLERVWFMNMCSAGREQISATQLGQ